MFGTAASITAKSLQTFSAGHCKALIQYNNTIQNSACVYVPEEKFREHIRLLSRVISRFLEHEVCMTLSIHVDSLPCMHCMYYSSGCRCTQSIIVECSFAVRIYIGLCTRKTRLQ